MAGHLILAKKQTLAVVTDKHESSNNCDFNEKEASCKGNPKDNPSLQETEVAYPTY